MKDYNGFSASERQKVSNIQRNCIMAGSWDYERQCNMCGQTDGKIMFHNEDYSTPLTGYPLCIPCHMILHARFFKPGRWIDHCFKLREGYECKPYDSVGAYFMATRGEQDYPLDGIVFEPDPSKWWENLLLTPVDLKPKTCTL